MIISSGDSQAGAPSGTMADIRVKAVLVKYGLEFIGGF